MVLCIHSIKASLVLLIKITTLGSDARPIVIEPSPSMIPAM